MLFLQRNWLSSRKPRIIGQLLQGLLNVCQIFSSANLDIQIFPIYFLHSLMSKKFLFLRCSHFQCLRYSIYYQFILSRFRLSMESLVQKWKPDYESVSCVIPICGVVPKINSDLQH
eukprot:NODE_255_length_11697_cov_0.569495.p8 type:complete len:116 gc:universal NODE_255_length_11697_cov_0.569495:490-143(-)